MDKNTKVIYSNAAGSITFDVAGDFWIESVTGIETGVDLNTSQSVGQLGVTVNGQSVRPKEPTINGVIVRSIPANRDRLLAVVLPLVPSRLTFVQPDGKSWYLEGWPKHTPILDNGQRPQHFQLQLFCPYPYFRSGEQRTYQLAGLTAMWRTPFTVGPHWISNYGEDSFVPVENTGSVPQAITLTIYAAAEVTKPSIHNVDLGTHITINKVLTTGERFVISTHDKDKDAGTAVRYFDASGGQHNGFKYITLDSDLSMYVAPGGNVFTQKAGANGQNCRCTLVTAGGERHSI